MGIQGNYIQFFKITEIAPSTPTSTKIKPIDPLFNRPWIKRGVRLEEHLQNDTKNNFKLIRLLAAFLVVFSHCAGKADPIAHISSGALSCGSLGLSVFFFLSGLLVSQSLDKSPSWKNFVWKRMLRIYPAACTAVLLCALLMGPLVASCPPKTYFSDPLFFQYLVTCSLLKVYYNLPCVFTHSPLGANVNSSLWTLSLELKLYAGLLLIILFGKKRAISPAHESPPARATTPAHESTSAQANTPWQPYPVQTILLWCLLLAGIAGGYFFYKIPGTEEGSFSGPSFSGPRFLAPFIRFGTFFVAGALCYRHRTTLVIPNYWIAAIPLFGLINIRFPFYGLATLVLVCALVLYLAVHGPRLALAFSSAPDLSYGIYVFAYPVQQLVVNYGNPGSLAGVFSLTLACALPLAAGSWYFVERKAMKWKYLVK